jgi:GT2 family glycosyltransferase
MRNTNLDLSIVIVSWNVRKLLEACLQSIFEATRGLRFEIIVVDNASHDGSPEIVARNFPDINLIENSTNVGFGTANNQALRLCRGEFVLLINPDTVVPKDAIFRLVKFLKEHPQAGLVGPEQRDGDGKLHLMNCVHLSPREMAEYLIERLASIPRNRTRILFSRPRQVSILNGGCWMVRNKAISEIGLFDEDLFLYGEEPDVCHRMRRVGWEIWFLRDVEIVHYRRQSINQRGFHFELWYFFRSMFIWLTKMGGQLLKD